MMIKRLPWIALGIGLLLALLTVASNPQNLAEESQIPLLAILFMIEFGALLCLAAVVISIREQVQQGFLLHGLLTVVANGLLLAYFANLGMNLWVTIN